jgi:hypothetical protein
VYPVTPVLSVEAVQESAIELAVAALLPRPEGALGALVSAQAAVEAELEERAERLPALSYASTASR